MRSYHTSEQKERALLVGTAIQGQEMLLTLEQSLAELARLAETAGVEVIGEISQHIRRPNPATLIGRGKVDELKTAVAALDATVVIFDSELSPRQQRELEHVLGEDVKLLDRTALILDIFARHAHTKEGALQVELAQYEYRLPRLTRAWTHLARQAGGGAARGGAAGVGLRGPGETQLEVDRREIGRRMATLRRQLEDVRAHRRRYRQRRQAVPLPVVALVGYTNAGKSTLLNRLTDADVLVQDQLFATLDPTTRRRTLFKGQEVLFSDTVGFIQKLPTQLVAAFRATLEEIQDADVVVKVVDAADAVAWQHYLTVTQTLTELGANQKLSMLLLNKVDLIPPAKLRKLRDLFPDGIFISARMGQGIDDFLARLESLLMALMVEIRIQLPFRRGDLASLFHRLGQVEREEHNANGIIMRGRIPKSLMGQFSPYQLLASVETGEIDTAGT